MNSKNCAQCCAPVPERHRYCSRSCRNKAYWQRKKDGEKGKPGAPALNGRAMTPAEWKRRSRQLAAEEGRTLPGDEYRTVDQVVPVFIGIDGEARGPDSVQYEGTEIYREQERALLAWEASLAGQFANERWRGFRETILDLGGIRLPPGKFRNDWSIVPVSLRRKLGRFPDQIVEDLARDYPQYEIFDEAGLYGRLNEYNLWATTKTEKPVRLATPGIYGLLQACAWDGQEFAHYRISDWVNGLSTITCFDFLLALSEEYNGKIPHHHGAPAAKLLWFGMDYDVNNILRDVPPEVLDRLYEYGNARWHNFDEEHPRRFYSITWHNRKMFSLSLNEYTGARKVDRRTGKRRKVYKTLGRVTTYDVWGFFQTTFVNACRGWKLLGEDSPELEFLEEMKALRGNFSQVEDEALERYNRLEVELTAKMGKLLWQTSRDMGFNLTKFHGAGALSQLFLDRYEVKEHLLPPETPPEITRAVRGAYFGGRIQLHRKGRTNSVYVLDINSAYPYALSQVPSLKDAAWESLDAYDGSRLALWHVRWDCKAPAGGRKHAIYPFPFRAKGGRIYWPSVGEGWYWTPEVKTAREHFPGMVEVLEGYALVLPNGHVRPFAFNEELYAERRAIKEREKRGEGYDIREKIIKLGMNGESGKMAQGITIRGETDGIPDVQLPKYQSYIFAGLLTSITRAMMLDAAMTDPRNVVAFATDGLIMRSPPRVALSDSLGGWSLKTGTDGIFIQPGFYTYLDEKGARVKRTRGVPVAAVDWEKIARRFQTYIPFQIECPTRQFIGLGVAMNGRWDLWRCWVEGTKVLSSESFSRQPMQHESTWDSEEESERYGESVIVGCISPGGVSLPYQTREEAKLDGDPYLALEQEELNQEFYE